MADRADLLGHFVVPLVLVAVVLDLLGLPLVGILEFCGLVVGAMVLAVIQIALVVEDAGIGKLLDILVLAHLNRSVVAVRQIVSGGKRLIEVDAVVLDSQITVVRSLIVEIFVLDHAKRGLITTKLPKPSGLSQILITILFKPHLGACRLLHPEIIPRLDRRRPLLLLHLMLLLHFPLPLKIVVHLLVHLVALVVFWPRRATLEVAVALPTLSDAASGEHVVGSRTFSSR